jgi:5-methylcytosine-specific restriction endonuclease McrA/predicted kinase
MPTAPPVHKRKAVGKRHGAPPETNRQARRALNTGSNEWRAIRKQVLIRDDYTCAMCGRYGNHVDHIDGDATNDAPDGSNYQTLCRPCHSVKTAGETGWVRLLPVLKYKPAIPVTLIAGPPGAGKTTHAHKRAGDRDTILDLDEIKASMAGTAPHDAPEDTFASAVAERNNRLMALSRARHGRCWFVVMAPTLAERRHWAEQLGAERVVLEVPSEECLRRIAADPARSGKPREFWERIVSRWWSRYVREAAGGGETVVR